MQRKIALTFLAVLAFLLLSSGFANCLSHCFDSTSYGNLYVQEIALDGGAFFMNVDTVSSAERFHGYEYTIEGENLYITIYSNPLHGGKWPTHIQIANSDFDGVNRVYLRDGDRKKQIYP